MCPSDVICLVSGLLSRQKQNEYCPHGRLHFLSSHTVKTKGAHMSQFARKEKDKDKGMAWIYRDSIQKQTQNTDCFSLFCCYSQFKCLPFSYQPKASGLLQNCNAVTLKCEKGVKTTAFILSSPFFIFSQHLFDLL